MKLGDRVKLKHLVSGETCAEGVVAGLYKTHEFHGSIIKPPYVRIQVEEVMKPFQELPVPNKKDEPPQLTLGDVLGTGCLWHIKGLKVKKPRKNK